MRHLAALLLKMVTFTSHHHLFIYSLNDVFLIELSLEMRKNKTILILNNYLICLFMKNIVSKLIVWGTKLIL